MKKAYGVWDRSWVDYEYRIHRVFADDPVEAAEIACRHFDALDREPTYRREVWVEDDHGNRSLVCVMGKSERHYAGHPIKEDADQ